MAKARAAQLAKNGRPGRLPGQRNEVTTEVKIAAQQIVDDKIYRANLLIAMRNREVAPGVEQMLWYFAKGKPKDTVVVDGSFTVGWIDSVAPALPMIDGKAEPEKKKKKKDEGDGNE
jgi:hypothetical protein